MTKINSCIRTLALVAGFALTCTSSALAATATTNFTVSATVVATCDVTATDLDFATYSSASGTPDDATNTVTATCTPDTTYTIALDGGAAADVSARTMTNGSDTLSYGLYTTAARTTIWGDGTAPTETVPGTGTGLPQDYTVYGRMPISQNVSAGLYTDTITVTVTY